MILRHRLSSFAIAVSAALTAHAQSSPIEMSQNFDQDTTLQFEGMVGFQIPNSGDTPPLHLDQY